MVNSRPRFEAEKTLLPTGAIDNHCHVLDPKSDSIPDAKYAPFEASVSAYDDHLSRLGASRGVLVTASTHGNNNTPMLEALQGSRHLLRGIAVVNQTITDEEISLMHETGVRGLRLQDQFPGGAPLDALEALGRRVAPLGWHIEIWTNFADHLDWLPNVIQRCPVPVVVDHLGYFPMEAENRTKATELLMDLAREGHIWITLSGSYRLAPKVSPRTASVRLAPRVNELLDKVPDRLLWGSDWPHVAPPNGAPTIESLTSEVADWFRGDQALMEQVLVANSVTCYDFPS